MTSYGLKRAAWLITRVKESFPQFTTSDFKVFSYGSMIDHVKAYSKSGHVYFDGLDMGIYDKTSDDIAYITQS